MLKLKEYQSTAYQALELKYHLKTIYPRIGETGLDLLVSSLTEYNPDMTTDEFLSWLEKQNKKTIFNINKVPLNKLSSWFFDKNNNLRHNSGKFFSIEGIHIKTDSGTVKEWKQPIINQPEVGILGILCQKHQGILYFLLQAKIEPGNINKIQMSPTVQATKSNYSQVHGGKLPQYLNFFLNFKNKKIIVDQLQSEQGARFFKKRNRNIIIEIPEAIKTELPGNYCWLTLGQIKRLMNYNNIINMDTRTVLSCTQIKAS